jgi:small subunit ribosomal protein S1
VGDELEGAVTKVVAFGAFVEILEGVEGLVHISELAQQHVENPREIVAPGDEVKVKILEIDSERRRLSLSIKRVEGQVLPRRTEGLTGDAGDLEDMPELGLSEDVFADGPATVPSDDAFGGEPVAEISNLEDAPVVSFEPAPEADEADAVAEPEADAAVAEPEAEEVVAEPEAEETVAEPEAETEEEVPAEPEAEAAAEPEAEAATEPADEEAPAEKE